MPELERRRVLSTIATGASASALSIGGSQTVEAQSQTKSVGKNRFAEVLLNHRYDARPLLTYNDDVLQYNIDRSLGEMLLYPFVSPDSVELLTGNSPIVKTTSESHVDELETIPTDLYGDTAKYAYLTGGSKIRLNETHTQPSVSVEYQEGKLLAETERQSISLTPGSSQTIELESRNVEVITRSKETDQISITPEITIRNFGELDIKKLERGGH